MLTSMMMTGATKRETESTQKHRHQEVSRFGNPSSDRLIPFENVQHLNARVVSQKIFEVQSHGIHSLSFSSYFDRNTTLIKMIEPQKNNSKCLQDVAKIFQTNLVPCNSPRDSVFIEHGKYSEETLSKFKTGVDGLHHAKVIDQQLYQKMIKEIESVVAKTEASCFSLFLEHFNKDVSSFYGEIARSKDFDFLKKNKIIIDGSLERLSSFIEDVNKSGGNSKALKADWLYLFLSEGALEHLIDLLDKMKESERQKRFEALHCGVMFFLITYERKLHEIVGSTINEYSEPFQRLYEDYKLMAKTGKLPPHHDFKGNLEVFRLFLAKRFSLNLTKFFSVVK